jgi:hypothetical protein
MALMPLVAVNSLIVPYIVNTVSYYCMWYETKTEQLIQSFIMNFTFMCTNVIFLPLFGMISFDQFF